MIQTARVLVQERSPRHSRMIQSAIRDDLARRSEMMSHTIPGWISPGASCLYRYFPFCELHWSCQALRYEGPDPTGQIWLRSAMHNLDLSGR